MLIGPSPHHCSPIGRPSLHSSVKTSTWCLHCGSKLQSRQYSALFSKRFAGSKNQGVGRWAPAATRFIAHAPNFPSTEWRSSTTDAQINGIWQFFLLIKSTIRLTKIYLITNFISDFSGRTIFHNWAKQFSIFNVRYRLNPDNRFPSKPRYNGRIS